MSGKNNKSGTTNASNTTNTSQHSKSSSSSSSNPNPNNSSSSSSSSNDKNKTNTTGNNPSNAPTGGRGHRQKGAGTTVVSKGDVTVAGITMKEWQRTPQTLLMEYTQHEKRPKPRYDLLRDEGDGIRYRVVLQDPKRPGTDKDLIFLPSCGFQDDAEAKHTVALLALHRINPTIPREQKLPEPYRTLWLTLNGQPGTSSTGTSSSGSTAGSSNTKDEGSKETNTKNKSSSSTSSSTTGVPSSTTTTGTTNTSSTHKTIIPPPTIPSNSSSSTATAAVSSSTVKATTTAVPTSSSSASNPNDTTSKPKRQHVIPLDVRLANSHASVADQKRERIEREQRRAERKNRKEIKLRELLSKHNESYIQMSSHTRDYVETILKAIDEERKAGFTNRTMEDTEDTTENEDSITSPKVFRSTEQETDEEFIDLYDTISAIINYTVQEIKSASTTANSTKITIDSSYDTDILHLLLQVIPKLYHTVLMELETLGFTNSKFTETALRHAFLNACIEANAAAKTTGKRLITFIFPSLGTNSTTTTVFSSSPSSSGSTASLASSATWFTSELILSFAIDHLCLYVPEDQLPKAFDPRAKTFEFHKVVDSLGSNQSTNSAPNGKSNFLNTSGGTSNGSSSSSISTTTTTTAPIQQPDTVVFAPSSTSSSPSSTSTLLSNHSIALNTLSSYGVSKTDSTSIITTIQHLLNSYNDHPTLASLFQQIQLSSNHFTYLCTTYLHTFIYQQYKFVINDEHALYSQFFHRNFGLPFANASSFETSNVQCDDPLFAAAQEIEASAGIYGNDFRIQCLSLPLLFVSWYLNIPIDELRGTNSNGRDNNIQYVWKKLSIRLHSSDNQMGTTPTATNVLQDSTLHMMYIGIQPRDTLPSEILSDNTGIVSTGSVYDMEWVPSVESDYSVLADIAATVSPSLLAKLYPNTLPQVWLSSTHYTPGLNIPLPSSEQFHHSSACLNLSLHLHQMLMDIYKGTSTYVSSSGTFLPLLYEIGSLCSTIAGETEKILHPPTVLQNGTGSGTGKSRKPASKSTKTDSSHTASSSTAPKPKRHYNDKNNAKNEHRPYRISSSMEQNMRNDDQAWFQAYQNKARDSAYQKMCTVRSKLPIANYREKVVSLVRNNQIILLSGETGCGKTTQVPQFLLEDAIEKKNGGHVRILCTQPRRIAAIGVAQRVANERCEPLGSTGGAIGYQIRGEKKAHNGTLLLFTTTGVLLRRLVNGLGHVTHIIVDEVHERGVDTDFLLAVLRKILPYRSDIKLILMSATMDAASFAAYFNTVVQASGVKVNPESIVSTTVTHTSSSHPSHKSTNSVANWEEAANNLAESSLVPVISVPGFVHPVKEVYLEDVLAMTGYIPMLRDKNGKLINKPHNNTPSSSSSAAITDTNPDENDNPTDVYDLIDENDIIIEGKNGANRIVPDKVIPLTPSSLDLRGWKSHGLDYGLVASLIYYLGHPSTSPHKNDDGSILVFMPGSIEIRKLHREIEKLGSIHHLLILHLHGSLTAAEQALVFQRAPHGKRKVVLATNVAETSITIDDITIVIDTFRVKESQYDPLNRMAKLVETWTSQAASKQRRGRAGRVRPGTCYRLIPKDMLSTLPMQTTPEIQRTPLESLCLQVKLLKLGKIKEFMNSLLDPPSASALKSALTNLIEMGALQKIHIQSHTGVTQTMDVELTSLGYHLALLPMDVRLGKALIYGSLLRCVDPILTIAAALSEKSPFRPIVPSMDDETKTLMQKARDVFDWGQSDHLAIVRAYKLWSEAGNWNQRRKFADEHYLSHETLRSIADLRTEYAGVLSDLGFLPGKVTVNTGKKGTRSISSSSVVVPVTEENDGVGETDEYSDDESTVLGTTANTIISTGTSSSANTKTSSVHPVHSYGRFGELSPSVNACSDQINILRAVLVAGFYPHVVKVVTPPRKYHDTAHGATRMDFKSNELRFYTLHEDEDESVTNTGNGTTTKNGKIAKGTNGKFHGKNTPKDKDTNVKTPKGSSANNTEDSPSSSDSETDSDAEILASREKTLANGICIAEWRGFLQDRVFIHPSSYCFSIGEYRCPWLVFHEKVSTTKVYIRDTSVITPYSMVLFGGPLTVDFREGKITVGTKKWITFLAEPRIGVLAKGLRNALLRLLADKIAYPSLDISSSPVIEVMLHILIRNGM